MRENVSSELDNVLDQVDGPVAIENCEFAANLDLAKTWPAIEAIDDDDLTICDTKNSLADLHEHQWPALHHNGRVVFRAPELDEPLAAALGLLVVDEVQP